MSAVPVPPPADRTWLQVERVARPLLAWVRPAVKAFARAGRRRLPGVAQAAGLGAVVAGVFVLAGLGVALVVGGILVAGLGVLFERQS